MGIDSSLLQPFHGPEATLPWRGLLLSAPSVLASCAGRVALETPCDKERPDRRRLHQALAANLQEQRRGQHSRSSSILHAAGKRQ